MSVAINQAVPDFQAPMTGNRMFTLKDYRGHKLVVYFYPKDNTPGCITEATHFRDQHAAFAAANTLIFGISRDSIASHEKFKTKLEMPFDLIADTDEAVCSLFDTIKMKKMYGKDVRGIERSTFLIDEQGQLRQSWRGVKVPNHVDEVLKAAQSLPSA